jgi:hypothetical protein
MDRFEKWLDKHDLPKNKLKVRGDPSSALTLAFGFVFAAVPKRR